MRSLRIGHSWSKCQNLNTWVVFWMNQAQMETSVIRRWRVRGKLRTLSGHWGILGKCNLRVLHESLPLAILFYCAGTIVCGEKENV